MIAEKPTEAVRDSMTVPAGSRRAAELARPTSLIFSLVSDTYSMWPSRICQTSASPNHGMVQSSQYSGRCRLGVCPERIDPRRLPIEERGDTALLGSRRDK